MSHLEKISKKLFKHCRALEIVLSSSDDCDVDFNELFQELPLLSSIIHCHLSDKMDTFKFIIQRKLSKVCPHVDDLLFSLCLPKGF
jgi:hypothetical protein